MITKVQKARIAVFAVAGAALVVLVLVVYGGRMLWRGHDRYYIEYEGSVYGLQDGGEVYLEGVRVGNVAWMEISRARLDHVRIAIDVERGTPVRYDTRAVLLYAGITGVKVVDLRGGSYAAPRLPAGGTIAVGETELDRVERKTAELADRADELFTQADRVVANLAQLTSPQALGEIVGQTRQTAANLQRASAALTSLVEENRAELRTTIRAVDRTAREASELLSSRVASFLSHADRVAAQLDQLVRSSSTPLHATISDLRDASRSLKEMAREVRQSPSRLLFSRPPPARRRP